MKEVAQSVDDWSRYVDRFGLGVDSVYVWL